MKFNFAAPVLCVALCATGGEALGHGGVYRGPSDQLPPGTGGAPSGPTTPGPGGPKGPTTKGGPSGPTTPGPSVPGSPGGGGRRGPVTKKNSGRSGSFSQWEFWWEHNKDQYLLQRHALGNRPSSGSIEFLTGMGSRKESSRRERIDRAVFMSKVLPTLTAALSEKDDDIVDSALIAIGRAIRADESATILPDIIHALGNSSNSVREAATLALGLIGSRDATVILLEIMNDTPAGRTHVNAPGKIQDRQRAFAATSLGYLDIPETVDALIDVMTNAGNSEFELRTAAILALGQQTNDHPKITRALLDALKDDRMEPIARSQVPVSLARLDARVAVSELLRLLDRNNLDNRLEESCVIALGQLAEAEDGDAIQALTRSIQKRSNEQARNFAIISIAQIASRAATSDGDGEDLAKHLIENDLLPELLRPRSRSHIPWAALAVAIAGRELPPTSSTRILATEKIASTFDDTNNPSVKSALAIGLGLLSAKQEGDTILAELVDTHDSTLKGYLALALGMMHHVDASPDMLRLVRDNRDPKMRLQVATGLGLLGDVTAVEVLCEELKSSDSLAVVTSLSQAIGMIGDRSAVEPLLEIATDKSNRAAVRGFALASLGLLCEKSELPWNTPLVENSNYRAAPSFLREIADIL